MAFKRLSDEQLVELVEAAIFVSEKPLSKRRLQETVLQDFNISAKRLTQTIDSLVEHYSTRGWLKWRLVIAFKQGLLWLSH